MITAKDLKNISDQHQCTEEEKNIIKKILDYCKDEALMGNYETNINAFLHMPNYPSLQKAKLYSAFPHLEIEYLKLKNQLNSLGFNFITHEISKVYINDFDNSHQQKIIVTIGWGG